MQPRPDNACICPAVTTSARVEAVPDWLIDRAKLAGRFRRGCGRESCGGCSRSTSSRRRTTPRSWRSAHRRRRDSTSSPMVRCGALNGQTPYERLRQKPKTHCHRPSSVAHHGPTTIPCHTVIKDCTYNNIRRSVVRMDRGSSSATRSMTKQGDSPLWRTLDGPLVRRQGQTHISHLLTKPWQFCG